MRTRCYLGFFSLLAVVCAAPGAVYAASRLLDFDFVAVGDTWNLAEGGYVFHDEESWCAFLGLPPGTTGTIAGCPEVDFRHETVIASVGGPRPSSCYGIQIDAIERLRGRTLEVTVAHTEPAFDLCVCSETDTRPVVAVAVSNPVGAVEFVHEDVQRGCGPCGFVSSGGAQTQCGFVIP